MENNLKIKIGDIIKVARKDGKIYECVIVKKFPLYNGFYGRVINSNDKVATASWKRYGLNENGIFESLDDCVYMKVLEESEVIEGKTSMSLKESNFSKEEVSDTKYYRVKVPKTENYITLCLCDNYGGWSTSDSKEQSLFESYVNSKSSSINSK